MYIDVFEYYKRSMIGRILLIMIFAVFGHPLHLRVRELHGSLDSAQL